MNELKPDSSYSEWFQTIIIWGFQSGGAEFRTWNLTDPTHVADMTEAFCSYKKKKTANASFFYDSGVAAVRTVISQ